MGHRLSFGSLLRVESVCELLRIIVHKQIRVCFRTPRRIVMVAVRRIQSDLISAVDGSRHMMVVRCPIQ